MWEEDLLTYQNYNLLFILISKWVFQTFVPRYTVAHMQCFANNDYTKSSLP